LSKELIIYAREKRGQLTQLLSPCMNIERVNRMKVLGITINDGITATDHVHTLLSSFSSVLYTVQFPCAMQSRHPSCITARCVKSDNPHEDYILLASKGR